MSELSRQFDETFAKLKVLSIVGTPLVWCKTLKSKVKFRMIHRILCLMSARVKALTTCIDQVLCVILLTSREIFQGHSASVIHEDCRHCFFAAHHLWHPWNDIRSIFGKHGIEVISVKESAFIGYHSVSEIRVNMFSEALEDLPRFDNPFLLLHYCKFMRQGSS
jgi:hypothetical protein